MASTSAAYLTLRTQRVARLVEERVDGVSVDRGVNGDVTVRLGPDGPRVATIVDVDSNSDTAPASAKTRLEYVTDGAARVKGTVARIVRLLSRRA